MQSHDKKQIWGKATMRKQLTTWLCSAALIAAAGGIAAAQEPVKIGVLGDMSSIYQGNSGQGSIVATKLAIDDFGGKVLGRPIEIVSGDHQVKPDIASALSRRWYTQEGVNVIVDAVSSGTSLAVAAVAKDVKKVFLASNAASSAFNMAQCNEYTVQWRSDTYASANAIVASTMKSGATTWFTIAADYNFGHALQAEAKQLVEAAGGKMVGGVRHPVGGRDFSSFTLAAQASGAQIIALANAGDDMVNTIKSADEFGLLTSPKQKMVSMLVFITDVHALGLKTVKGLVVVSDFYWDFDEKTRAFAERYFKAMNRMPTMSHAAAYSAVTHYLKSMEAAKSDKAEDVMAMMHKIPVDDMYARNAKLRPDNLLIHDTYLLQVKTPEESKKPWDYYKVLDVIPGEKAFRPLSQSTCPLVKK